MNEKYMDYFLYYAELEKEFFLTESFVTIEKDNFKTYSIKYNMLYQSICSEIDCLLKEICNLINPSIKVRKMPEYYDIVVAKYKKITKEVVIFNKSKIQIKPWAKWTKEKAPEWWTYYNNVKHHRFEKDKKNNYNYKNANLKNLMNALAALYIVEQYYMYSYNYSKEGDISSKKKDSDIYIKELQKRKTRAFLINHSIKCTMKRWKDNGCYTSFMGQEFFNIDILDKII